MYQVIMSSWSRRIIDTMSMAITISINMPMVHAAYYVGWRTWSGSGKVRAVTFLKIESQGCGKIARLLTANLYLCRANSLLSHCRNAFRLSGCTVRTCGNKEKLVQANISAICNSRCTANHQVSLRLYRYASIAKPGWCVVAVWQINRRTHSRPSGDSHLSRVMLAGLNLGCR